MPSMKRKSQSSLPFKVQKKARTYARSIKEGAKVALSRTTRSLSAQPFPNKCRKFLTYESILSDEISGALGAKSVRIVANGLFDLDYDNWLENKQPLYFDQLCSATGPYRWYKVLSWKTTWTVINTTACPLNVIAFPGSADPADIDSQSEASNMPGIVQLPLTSIGSSHDMGKITLTGNYRDVYGSNTGDNGVIGTYNANPGAPIYAGLYIQAAKTNTVCLFHVAVKHEVYVEFTNNDAIVS